MTGTIFDIKRYAIHDGPGIRTTVFLKGCPLRCSWCHNPESWAAEREFSIRTGRCTTCGRCAEACPNDAVTRPGDPKGTDPSRCVLCGACVEACPTGAREIVGRQVTVQQTMAEVLRDRIFFEQSGGGVTFSGGEPLAQAEFLTAMLALCKTEEIHTALDTSCHAPWEILESVLPMVDLFLCDLKQMDARRHQEITGVSNELILENLRQLDRRGAEIIIRIPIIPGVNDDGPNLVASAEFVASLPAVARVDLLPYNEAVRGKLGRLGGDYAPFETTPPTDEQMKTIAARFQRLGLQVKIGG